MEIFHTAGGIVITLISLFTLVVAGWAVAKSGLAKNQSELLNVAEHEINLLKGKVLRLETDYQELQGAYKTLMDRQAVLIEKYEQDYKDLVKKTSLDYKTLEEKYEAYRTARHLEVQTFQAIALENVALKSGVWHDGQDNTNKKLLSILEGNKGLLESVNKMLEENKKEV